MTDRFFSLSDRPADQIWLIEPAVRGWHLARLADADDNTAEIGTERKVRAKQLETEYLQVGDRWVVADDAEGRERGDHRDDAGGNEDGSGPHRRGGDAGEGHRCDL